MTEQTHEQLVQEKLNDLSRQMAEAGREFNAAVPVDPEVAEHHAETIFSADTRCGQEERIAAAESVWRIANAFGPYLNEGLPLIDYLAVLDHESRSILEALKLTVGPEADGQFEPENSNELSGDMFELGHRALTLNEIASHVTLLLACSDANRDRPDSVSSSPLIEQIDRSPDVIIGLGFRLGAAALFSILFEQKDLERGFKILQSAKKGHEETHGTKEDRLARNRIILTHRKQLDQKYKNRSVRDRDKEIAEKFHVSARTVQAIRLGKAK